MILTVVMMSTMAMMAIMITINIGGLYARNRLPEFVCNRKPHTVQSNELMTTVYGKKCRPTDVCL